MWLNWEPLVRSLHEIIRRQSSRFVRKLELSLPILKMLDERIAEYNIEGIVLKTGAPRVSDKPSDLWQKQSRARSEIEHGNLRYREALALR